MKFSETSVPSHKKLGALHQGDWFVYDNYHYIITDSLDNETVLVVCLEDGETIWMNIEKIVNPITIEEIIFHKG